MDLAIYRRSRAFFCGALAWYCLSVFPMVAETFEFTTKAGYPTPSTSLEGTPLNAPLWTVSSSTNGPGFFVDGAAGFVSANPAGDSASAAMTKPFPLTSGKTLSVSLLFQFEGVDVESQENILLPGIYLGTSPKFFQFAGGITLGHFPWAQSDYVLQVHEMSKGLAKFMASDLGIVEAGKLSQKLRLTLQLSKGASPDDWSYDVSLDNTETNTNIAHLSGKASLPETVFDAPALFFHLQRGSSKATGGAALIRIHRVDISIAAN